MDIDGDGTKDIISGSYCCDSEDDDTVAGYFYKLKGLGKGNFGPPEVIKGKDNKELIISSEDSDERMSTRPFAVDINADGNLDLIVGSTYGSFYQFNGEKGGTFAPKSTRVVDSSNKPLKVNEAADPFLIDFDADGDLDILSGSYYGGVYLSVNLGTAKKASFAPFQEIIKPIPGVKLTKQVSMDPNTRVCVADFNGDGKLDLIVGDHTAVFDIPKGVTKEQAKILEAEFNKKELEIEAKVAEHQKSNDNSPEHRKIANALSIEQRVHSLTRHKFRKSRITGYVWIYLQK